MKWHNLEEKHFKFFHYFDLKNKCKGKGKGKGKDIGKGKDKGKSKAIPLQTWAGPEGSGRLRLPDFKIIVT